MIKTQSDDPDVAEAAKLALDVIDKVLTSLSKAEKFDYGGHNLSLGEYDVCTDCTAPIAEAQAAEQALRAKAEELDDDTVKEHLTLAADLFRIEAEAATIRAEFHNGHSTEQILNRLLGFVFERHIDDDFEHSHHKGA
jgi:hypothetical protein